MPKASAKFTIIFYSFFYLLLPRNTTQALLKRYQSSSFRVGVSCICSAVSGVEHQLPAFHAPVFLLQPPHVINHVKWQKSTTLSRLRGRPNGVENGMFCPDAIHFVPPLPRLLACLLSPCPPKNRKFFFWCQIPKVKAASILSKDPDGNNTAEKFWLVLVVVKMSP